jgi:hypothetical protein
MLFSPLDLGSGMEKFKSLDFWVKNTEILCKFSAVDPKPGSGAF